MASFPEFYREPLDRDYAKCHLCRNERQLPLVHRHCVCDHHVYLQEKTTNAQQSGFREIGTRSVQPDMSGDSQMLRFNMSK